MRKRAREKKKESRTNTSEYFDKRIGLGDDGLPMPLAEQTLLRKTQNMCRCRQASTFSSYCIHRPFSELISRRKEIKEKKTDWFIR